MTFAEIQLAMGQVFEEIKKGYDQANVDKGLFIAMLLNKFPWIVIKIILLFFVLKKKFL